jgi:membrane associated rhomboid family serine protease
MDTGRKRSALSYIPGYRNNAVLQLIIFSGVAYVMFAVSWAIVMIVYQNGENFTQYFIPNIALPVLSAFKHHWWTVFTYGWFHYPQAFWELVSNMLWLYCFGSVVQMLVGHKQVIPLYAYSLLAGGVFYVIAQLLPGEWGKCPPYIMGPRAGLIGMAVAAITLAPHYRFYLTETFSIRLMVVAGIFAVLMILGSGFYLPVIFLLAGGGAAGLGYVKLLRAGYRPGEWIYNLSGRLENMVTPNEDSIRNKKNVPNKRDPRSGISQKRVDEILDKINQKGYNSLSAEEKEILVEAAKEK